MTTDLKPYPEYKDSGLPWLGKVPKHWNVHRLKRHLSRNDGGVWGSDFGDDGTIVLRSTEQTVDGHWRFADPARRTLTAEERSNALLAEGDLLVTKSSGSPAHIGKTTLVTADVAANGCCFSNFMQRLRLDRRLVPQFGWRILNSNFARQQLQYLSNSTTGLGNLSSSILGNIWVAVPSQGEQETISRFLHDLDRQVRRFIRNRRRLIEVLNEQKQAIINRAVTRGLDPDAPLKPSGIDWLGDIPEHWTCVRLKQVARVQTGITLGKNYRGQRLEERPYLRVANVQVGQLDLRQVKTVMVPPSEIPYRELRSGDVLMTEGGDIDKLGRGCVWRYEIEGCLHQNHIFAVRVFQDKIVPEYLVALMASRHGRIYFEKTAKRTTNLASTNSTTLGVFPLMLPPVEEQRRILTEIGSETAELEALLSRADGEISLIREYRTRLIADVVTGKVDVRHLAPPPESEDLEEAADELEPLDDTVCELEDEALAGEVAHAD